LKVDHFKNLARQPVICINFKLLLQLRKCIQDGFVEIGANLCKELYNFHGSIIYTITGQYPESNPPNSHFPEIQFPQIPISLMVIFPNFNSRVSFQPRLFYHHYPPHHPITILNVFRLNFPTISNNFCHFWE